MTCSDWVSIISLIIAVVALIYSIVSNTKKYELMRSIKNNCKSAFNIYIFIILICINSDVVYIFGTHTYSADIGYFCVHTNFNCRVPVRTFAVNSTRRSFRQIYLLTVLPGPHRVSCSIGAHRYSCPVDLSSLMENTDAALYEAKSAERPAML